VIESNSGGARTGLMPGLTFSCYCRLIDWTSRLAREGKVSIAESVASIFDRLHADPDEWAGLVSKLQVLRTVAGSHFGAPARLAEAPEGRASDDDEECPVIESLGEPRQLRRDPQARKKCRPEQDVYIHKVYSAYGMSQARYTTFFARRN
jgi:hypothetical protein